MTRVVALVAWSNGAITMEEKGVYDIDDALATDLIAQGLCADAATYFGGGGSGGGVLVVTDTLGKLDKTWVEINAGISEAGYGVIVISTTDATNYCPIIEVSSMGGDYLVGCISRNSGNFITTTYFATSPFDIPRNNPKHQRNT